MTADISPPTMLRVAQIAPETEAEGPGARFAIWVQGCTIRCPGCCNPEMFPPSSGRLMEVATLAQQVLASPNVEGVSVLGGEPFEQAEAVAELCAQVRAGGKSTMVFSGYSLDSLRARGEAASRLLASLDLLVDGEFRRELPESRRRWIGSQNQVMHFLTERYSPDDPQFQAPNTVELRFDGRSLTVNGWPDLAKQLRRRSR